MTIQKTVGIVAVFAEVGLGVYSIWFPVYKIPLTIVVLALGVVALISLCSDDFSHESGLPNRRGWIAIAALIGVVVVVPNLHKLLPLSWQI